MKYDYLIVGAGIAGSVLAYELNKKNRSFLIADENEQSSASKVAAGIYSPVVFKRLTRSWKAEELIPAMLEFYSEAENVMNRKIIHPVEIFKIFSSVEEQNNWVLCSERGNKYLTDKIFPDAGVESIYSPFGGAYVKQSGYINVQSMLEGMADLFKSEKRLINTNVNYEDIVIKKGVVLWNGNEFGKIIFCEGYKTTRNPWFSCIPFVPAKGEVIAFYSKGLNLKNIVNCGIYIVPLGDNKYISGSNYEWNFTDDRPTEKIKNEFALKLQSVIKVPFEVISHSAGIRPAVKDRRPVLGTHPQYPEIGIFNGMGTKGVMLAPYFSEVFIKFLEEQKTLSKEVDIVRFWKN
jgi:glycine/D-amino acid oxidase-like deaminating enzyme